MAIVAKDHGGIVPGPCGDGRPQPVPQALVGLGSLQDSPEGEAGVGMQASLLDTIEIAATICVSMSYRTSWS